MDIKDDKAHKHRAQWLAHRSRAGSEGDNRDPQKERFYVQKPTGTPNTNFRGEMKTQEDGEDKREGVPPISNRPSHRQRGGFTYKEISGHWPLPFPTYSYLKVSIQQQGDGSGWQVSENEPTQT